MAWSKDDLARVDPVNDDIAQPEWVKSEHPDYVEMHHGHGLKRVETFEHAGHSIEIETSIAVKINGNTVMLHAHFDEDGKIHCHNAPYEFDGTVEDLVRVLIDNTPAEGIPEKADNGDHGNGHHGGGHHGHGHHGHDHH